MDNWIQQEIDKYGQDKLIEAGIVLLEQDREIKTLSELATQFCCLTECENCPVHIHKVNYRTEEEEKELHIHCVDNLYKWIIEESKKQKVGEV